MSGSITVAASSLEAARSLGRPRPRSAPWADLACHGLLASLAALVLAVAILILFETARGAAPSISAFGFRFLGSTEWDPVADRYGALPYLYGTIVSSALALTLALPLGVGTAVFLAELAPPRLGEAVAFLVELLAAIPSIVYGIWGVFVLAPWLRSALEPWLVTHLGFLPLFRGFPFGIGMLNAGIVLAVMVSPTIISLSRQILLALPGSLREAALAMGATRAEAIGVMLDAARPGLLGASILGLGRALGETMAVTMVGLAARSRRHHGERDRERVHRGDREALSLGAHRDRAGAVRAHRDRERARAPARARGHGRPEGHRRCRLRPSVRSPRAVAACAAGP